MKYCTHCGKELLDEAVLCMGCGCAAGGNNIQMFSGQKVNGEALISRLSERLNINGIIWLVIGILQILGGIFISYFLLIVGVLNIISSVNDMQYSKTLKDNPSGIVARFEPITMPIITLVYNLVVGGVIGVVGSIYYFVAIRNYVMENRQLFEILEK